MKEKVNDMKIKGIESSEPLFEDPEYFDKEMPSLNYWTTFISQTTFKNDCTNLRQFSKGAETYSVFKRKNSIFLGKYAKRQEDGEPGLELLGQMDLKNPLNFSNENIPSILPKNTIQVDGVEIESEVVKKGLGYQIYKALLTNGYCVLSDNVQYRGGKAIWKKISKLAYSEGYKVFIIQNGEYLLDNNGNKFEYDGSNLPDDQIWGKGIDKFYTLFVAEKF